MAKQIYKTEEERKAAEKLIYRRYYEKNKEKKKLYQKEYAARKRQELKEKLERLEALDGQTNDI